MLDAYVYAGLAGDTGPGKRVSAGLYRSREGRGAWEPVAEALLPRPQVRAICTDPARPGYVTIATQAGLYRSDDHGEQWRKLPAPAPELAVWSLLRHPADGRTMLAGYEPCAIHRTTDDGATWQALPVAVTFPDVTLNPEPQPKRITGMAIDPNEPDAIYASIEVGGLLRSLDGGRSWACVTEGLYLVDDALDLHRVLVSPAAAGLIILINRIGIFRSADRGAHWASLQLPALTGRGTYCRDLALDPEAPDRIYVAAGIDFDGDRGALFASEDGGRRWTRLDLGAEPGSTIFGFAVDPTDTKRLYCVSKGGQFFWSEDRGRRWRANPLPPGAGQVYALAAGP